MRGFLEARHSWELGSSITTIEFSLFRLLLKVSAVNVRWTEQVPYLFFFTKNHKLALSCVSQATQYSPGVESPEISKLVNRLIVACLMTASLRFAPRQ